MPSHPFAMPGGMPRPPEVVAHIFLEALTPIEAVIHAAAAAGDDPREVLVVLHCHDGAPADFQAALRQEEHAEAGEVPVEVAAFDRGPYLAAFHQAYPMTAALIEAYGESGGEGVPVIVMCGVQEAAVIFWPAPRAAGGEGADDA